MFLLSLFIACFGDKTINDTNSSSEEYELLAPDDCSYNGGDIICDFTLKDQFDQEFRLWDNHGKVTVIDLSTIWCPYCRTAADLGKELHDENSEEDFLWTTIIIEDNNGEDPNIYDVQMWAGNFELSHPVLQGRRSLIDTEGQRGFPVTGFPVFVILDENYRIRKFQQGWNEYSIRESVKELLEE